ncbi:probable thiopurine S-methyltransferase isoform X1 [Haliotis asinina]|uniref:probable thiopurine S-methyltransferase isoform X1 n=1 Tax=Haliotis asinina TaxID=109174 RepID=UPI0035324865
MSKKERARPGHWQVSETPEGRIQDWMTEWEKGHWDFTYTEPGSNLEKYFEKVTDGRKGLKILLPLCATTYDLIWFCEQGHTVVGADLAESAAQRIFKQYKQKPIIEEVPSINGKLYKNETGTFKFYVGNFLLFNEDLEGKFDFIWDSKAMCAVDPRDRPTYLKVIRSVMGPKCIIMLEFPKKIFPGAPYCFSEEQLKEFYGDICDLEYQDQYDFNICKAYHGDVDDDGQPLKQEEGKDESKEEEEDKVICLQSYCLRKRE